MSTLTVTTLNVHYGGRSPGGRERYDLAAATAGLPGTVRAFQEVWHHPDEPSRLHVPEGWQVVEHVVDRRVRPRKHRLAEPAASRRGVWSIVVVTAHPVLDRWIIDLPALGGDPRRSALAVRLDTPLGELSVVAVHLTAAFVPVGSAAQVLASRRRLPGGPLVVMGDHNLWARATGRLRPGFTLAGRGPTFEAPQPRHQIDHIWVRGLSVVDACVLPSVGSDHLPVTATLAAR